MLHVVDDAVNDVNVTDVFEVSTVPFLGSDEPLPYF